MPTPAYLSVTGAIQKDITNEAGLSKSIGAESQKGFANKSRIHAFTHEITIPYNPQSGGSTGQHIHHPVCITKFIDKASPLLLTALTTGEELTEVLIEWYRMNNNVLEHYYTTRLNQARVVAIKEYIPNCQDPKNLQFSHLEDVHFSYKKISWHHKLASTDGEDSWDKQQ
ncbi:Hcp family type VI secretion system effector [Pseudomonas syringae]|nr:Hcp family type VI secretion system effector [Pseudomonas syringae]